MGCDCGKPRDAVIEEEVVAHNGRRKSDPLVIFSNVDSFRMLLEPFTSTFRVTTSLGEGISFRLFAAKYRDSDLPCLVSVFPKAKSKGKATQRFNLTEEIKRLSRLDHPHILRLFEALEDQDNYYIVQQHSEGSLIDVRSHPTLKDENCLAQLTFQMLSALAYAHSCGFRHGHLTPAHVVFAQSPDSGVFVKLTGFGLLDTVALGPETPGPNELVLRSFERPDQEVTEQTDAWFVGALLYLLVAGQPLKQLDIARLRPNSPQLVDLVTRLLEANPARRLTVLQARSHRWIQDRVWWPTNRHMRAVLRQVQYFRPSNPLRDVILAFILHRFVPEREYSVVANVFAYLDSGSGRLRPEDLVKAFKFIMFEDDARRAADLVMSSADLDKNGYLSFSEFLIAGIGPAALLSADNIQRTFAHFDQNRDGNVSIKEFRRILSLQRVRDWSQDWRKLIALADTDGDGRVNAKEFRQLLVSTTGVL